MKARLSFGLVLTLALVMTLVEVAGARDRENGRDKDKGREECKDNDLLSRSCLCERPSDIDIVARTTISGLVNGSAMQGTVLSLFNTGRGGSSSCAFSQLPAGFTPASIGTHA
jgi:hypothetical protein